MPLYQLQRLQAKHRRVLELHLAGLSNVQIAEEVRATPVNISSIINSPAFQSELVKRRDEQNSRIDETESVKRLSAGEILQNRSCLAAETMTGLLGSGDESIQHRAASDILDRTGFPKVSKSESKHFAAHVILDAGAVARLQKATQDCFEGSEFLTFPLESSNESETSGQAADECRVPG